MNHSVSNSCKIFAGVSVYFQASPGEEHFAVELQRGTKGFGFSIRGGAEFQQELFVLRIAESGPAHMDGRLRVGDKLIEVNGILTKGMSHERAIQLIKRETVVKLLVRREPIPTTIGEQKTNYLW